MFSALQVLRRIESATNCGVEAARSNSNASLCSFYFCLLEHRGKLVNREQIVARLWCDESFLDTERSINTAVRKIRKALGDNPRRPRFIETVVGKGYRFIAPLEQEDPRREIESDVPPAVRADNRDGSEIRLRGFSVEADGGPPILTCDVVVSNIHLGRIPLMELELPADVTLPLKPKDRLLLKLHGVRVTLTAKAVQALHAVSISVLQSGLRTRVTDSNRLNKEPLGRRSPPMQIPMSANAILQRPPIHSGNHEAFAGAAG